MLASLESLDFTIGAMQDHCCLIDPLAPETRSLASVKFFLVENPVAPLVRVLNSPHLIYLSDKGP